MFYPGPMVSFRIARKNISYLVKAKVYPFERTVDSFKCNKSRFHTYLNVNETDTFTSTVTRKTYKISNLFDCSDKYLIYLLTYKKYLIQYVGKIVNVSRYRWNNCKNYYRNYDCNQPCLQRHLYKHYSSVCHCGLLEHVSMTVCSCHVTYAFRPNGWVFVYKLSGFGFVSSCSHVSMTLDDKTDPSCPLKREG